MVGPPYPGISLLELQGPSLCFAGACPRDGSVEATHPTPAPYSPCWEPLVPSWALWPLATLLSELRREQGRPASKVGGVGSLNPGRVGCKKWLWPPETGGRRWRQCQRPRPSLAWFICCSGVNSRPVERFHFHSLFPWPLPGACCSFLTFFLASDRLCGGCDFALLKSLILAVLEAEGS